MVLGSYGEPTTSPSGPDQISSSRSKLIGIQKLASSARRHDGIVVRRGLSSFWLKRGPQLICHRKSDQHPIKRLVKNGAAYKIWLGKNAQRWLVVAGSAVRCAVCAEAVRRAGRGRIEFTRKTRNFKVVGVCSDHGHPPEKGIFPLNPVVGLPSLQTIAR